MKSQLSITFGQASDAGRKSINQDAHGVEVPGYPLLQTKGITAVLADGISSSQVSQEASSLSVNNFLADYYCTSDAWSVKNSALKVIQSMNSWLCSQTRRSQYRFDKNKGYVCTFNAIVFRSNTAHLFHVGDSRIYRLSSNGSRNHLEQLTEDHRLIVSDEKSYLSRALGIKDFCEVDYQEIPIEQGDIFLSCTDGIYEFIKHQQVIELIEQHKDDLNKAAKQILKTAYENGSDDNLTLQIMRIESLPEKSEAEFYHSLVDLPFPERVKPRQEIDGYRIIREIYISSRSYVYLALDLENSQEVILKFPSLEGRVESGYMERFLMEEWIARRIDSSHVVKAYAPSRKRHYQYIALEYIKGVNLDQWMRDNPQPDIDTVRDITEQIAKGLLAFHRQEMIHQDLRPNNVMIDYLGTVKIIDFGSTYVRGISEGSGRSEILGTAAFTAPEYFLGQGGFFRSDLFSLAVITYQMLSGSLPYGTKIAQARTKNAQKKLHYQTVLNDDREIPAWVDFALKKALAPDPHKRYAELSEFTHDLRHPSTEFLNKTKPPMLEDNPLLFWKLTSLLLFIIVIILIATR